MPKVHQHHRQTDGRTTYDSNTALALGASRGKTAHLAHRERRQPKCRFHFLTDYAQLEPCIHATQTCWPHPLMSRLLTVSCAFRAAAAKLWNNLPSFVKSSCSYDVFKRRVVYLSKFLPSHLWVVVGVSVSLLCYSTNLLGALNTFIVLYCNL